MSCSLRQALRLTLVVAFCLGFRATPASADVPPPPCPAPGEVQVLDAYRVSRGPEVEAQKGDSRPAAERPHDVELGDVIALLLARSLGEERACLGVDKRVVLFVDGMPLTNLIPGPGERDSSGIPTTAAI